MKPSISISTYKPKFAPITLQAETIKEFDSACRFASESGYSGVDLFINKKTDEEILEIRDVLRRYNLTVSMLICIYLAEQGVNFTYKNTQDRVSACDTYGHEMRLAEILGAKTMPVGLIRGKLLEDDTYETYYERLADSCVLLSREAIKHGIKLCIEPVNRYEIDTLNSVSQTIDFIKNYNLDEMYIVPDLFHMNIEDVDICQTLKSAGSLIQHMHVSDSNRRAPGMGNLDYKSILQTLKEIGYDNYLTIETLNFGETEKTVKQGAKYLNSILCKL